MSSTKTGELPIYKFKLEGRVVPKARPRYSKKTRKHLLPQNYRKWKNNAIAQLVIQRQDLRLDSELEEVKVHVDFYGGHRGDLDNMIGSVLDACVQANIIVDDRLAIVSEISARYFKDSETRSEILITDQS